ncbi:hypothetical protein GCM10023083_38030 [Streptomyces phyllanthi]
MLPGSVSWGIAVQVFTQCRWDVAEFWTAMSGSPSLSVTPTADKVARRASARRHTEIRWTSGEVLGDCDGDCDGDGFGTPVDGFTRVAPSCAAGVA